MSMKLKSRDYRTYSPDKLATNLWLNLVKDFRSVHGIQFCSDAEEEFKKGIANFRNYTFPSAFACSAPFFKAQSQMECLLKKYRYVSDKFTDTQLEELTTNAYIDFQPTISTPIVMTPLTSAVLSEARKIATSILGSFDPELVLVDAKFGKKSSIGCPLSLAYIDEKLSNIRAFTGSSRCAKWFFDKVLPEDGILRRIIDRLPNQGRDGDLAHESLTLVNVPKTWKTLRSITPLTLLGLFYSYGVGALVTAALEKIGIDIRRQQDRHRKWIRRYSVTGSHVTADLTRASDSITLELLMRVLPRPWYRAVRMCLTDQIVIKRDGLEDTYKTASVLPMGNGATFPVETLVFYTIIKAIGNLSGIEGRFSVYGDDLIYPAGIHKYVLAVFPHLHFSLNMEKTFVEKGFRESCGSDYFRGADVRPFYFKADNQQCTSTKYLALLYKTYNGLCRRFDALEIRGTLFFLLVEIANVADTVYRVPKTYPDTAGIKVEYPGFVPLDCLIVNWSSITTVFQDGSQWHRFTYLAERSVDRFVSYIEPYYWLALQGLDDVPDPDFGCGSYTAYGTPPEPALMWRRFKRHRTYTVNGKRKQKVVDVYKAVVASRMATKQISVTDSVSDWI